MGDTTFENGVLLHPDGVELARLFETLLECRDRVGGVSLEEAARKVAATRAIRRQSETLLGIRPYRLATPFTVAPSISVSTTIRAFSSRGQRRLPSEPRGILARSSFIASM